MNSDPTRTVTLTNPVATHLGKTLLDKKCGLPKRSLKFVGLANSNLYVVIPSYQKQNNPRWQDATPRKKHRNSCIFFVVAGLADSKYFLTS
jgi:hypothetical protein